jgi:hypothetical protein
MKSTKTVKGKREGNSNSNTSYARTEVLQWNPTVQFMLVNKKEKKNC